MLSFLCCLFPAEIVFGLSFNFEGEEEEEEIFFRNLG
jgi:hypothetical protein